MSRQFYKNLHTLISILLTSTAIITTANSEPKFGDRIGKLKRNFQPSLTSTTTTTIATNINHNDLNDDFNDIHRSDDYFSLDDHDNKKFMVLINDQQKHNGDIKFR